MKLLSIFILILLVLGLVSSTDSQIIVVCGGDKQTVVGCITGDIETANVFQTIPDADKGVLPFGISGNVTKEGVLKQLFPFLLGLLILFVLGFIFVIIKRKKKKLTPLPGE